MTKGIVRGIINNNRFVVYIPSKQAQGSSKEYRVLATLCYSPGNMFNIKTDDVVYVEYDENNTPVIIGKLYTGEEETATNYSFNQNLTVSGKTVLSCDTTIGDMSWDTAWRLLRSLENRVQNIEDYLRDSEGSEGF